MPNHFRAGADGGAIPEHACPRDRSRRLHRRASRSRARPRRRASSRIVRYTSRSDWGTLAGSRPKCCRDRGSPRRTARLRVGRRRARGSRSSSTSGPRSRFRTPTETRATTSRRTSSGRSTSPKRRERRVVAGRSTPRPARCTELLRRADHGAAPAAPAVAVRRIEGRGRQPDGLVAPVVRPPVTVLRPFNTYWTASVGPRDHAHDHQSDARRRAASPGIAHTAARYDVRR